MNYVSKLYDIWRINMTLGEVRGLLEKDYQTHYKQVKLLNYTSKEKAINYIQEQTSCSYEMAKRIVEEWLNINRTLKNDKNICTPKCPTCQSTDIKKIAFNEKATGYILFGLFSKTARSQFECENCGYKW